MRKLILAAVAMFSLLLMGQSPYMVKSDDLVADGLVYTGRGYLYGALVITDGASAELCTIYDNTSAAGSTLVPAWTVTTSATDRSASVGFSPGLYFKNGIYVDCGATGTIAVYYYPID